MIAHSFIFTFFITVPVLANHANGEDCIDLQGTYHAEMDEKCPDSVIACSKGILKASKGFFAKHKNWVTSMPLATRGVPEGKFMDMAGTLKVVPDGFCKGEIHFDEAAIVEDGPETLTKRNGVNLSLVSHGTGDCKGVTGAIRIHGVFNTGFYTDPEGCRYEGKLCKPSKEEESRLRGGMLN